MVNIHLRTAWQNRSEFLRERNKGRQSRRHGHVSQQLLSDSEEKALVKWITTLTLTGLLPSYSIIETIASINTSSIQLVSYPPLGKNWVPRLIKHHPHLKAMHPHRIDASRANESTKEAIEI